MHSLIDLIGVGIMVFLMFLGMSTPFIVVCFFNYLKRRSEHKQIMAAIEKGVPFSTIKPPKPVGPTWIKNISAAIALLIISAGFVIIPLICRRDTFLFDDSFGFFIIALIFFALGISRLIRGLLQRNSHIKNTPR